MIKNKSNGKIYIGQSKTCTTRWRSHRYNLASNKHTNSYLQNVYNKHGIEIFEFSIIERCSEEFRDEREKYWIDFYKSNDVCFGYNLQSGGCKNKTLSKITRDKIGRANRGKRKPPRTKEHCYKISKSHKGRSIFPNGRVFTGEHKKKIGESNKGRAVWNKGVPMTKERLEALISINKGRVPWNKGIPHTQEIKEKLRENHKGNKGKIFGYEHKKKISDSQPNKVKETPEMINDAKQMTLTLFKKKYGHGRKVWQRIRRTAP
jgi:group I intron endonuclease